MSLSFQESKSGMAATATLPGPSYQTLTAETISKKMFDIVDEVNVVFQVRRGGNGFQ